jgi:predicted amidohydrolase YtcJ
VTAHGGEATETIDLAGRALLLGLVDDHGHALSRLGNDLGLYTDLGATGRMAMARLAAELAR